MVSMAEIEAVGKRIGEEFGAERVILFGSHASGTAGPHSDVDLLVVLPGETPCRKKSATIRASLHTSFPLDILVHSKVGLEHRLDLGDGFLAQVLETGKVLHEAAHG